MDFRRTAFKFFLSLFIIPTSLLAQTSPLTITIVDSASNPRTVGTLDSVTVACNDYEGLVYVSEQVSNGQSSVVLNIPNNTGVNCTFTYGSHLQGYLLDGSTYVFVSGSASRNLFVTTLDANLNISFVNSANSPKVIPSGSSARINCTDYSSGINLTEDLNVGATSVTLPVVGNRSYNCSIYGLNGAQAQDAYVYAPSAGTGTASIIIRDLDATITLSFQDTKGNIFTVPSGTSAFISCYGDIVVSSGLEGGAQGISLSAASGAQYYCSGYVPGNPSFLGASVDLRTSTSGSGVLKFAVPDAMLNVSLVRISDGTPYSVPSGSYSSIYCYGSEGYFSDSIEVGNNAKEIDIVSGTYTCGAYIPGVAVAQAQVTVAVGTTGSVSVGIATRDYTVNVSIKDPNGNLIDVDGVVYAYTTGTDLSDYTSGTISAGTGSFNAIGSTYALNFSSNSSTATSGLILDNAGTPYIQSFDISSVTVPSANTSANLVLYPADATINVSISGVDGLSTWISANQINSTTAFSVGGFSNETGQLSLSLPAGTYQVFAYSSGSALAPAAQEVTVASNSSASISIAFQSPDYTLSITGAVSDGASGDFSCSIYSPSQGYYAYTSVSPFGSAVSAGLLKSVAEWIITCFGYGQDSAGNFNIYSSDFDLYKTLANRTSDSVSITLSLAGSAINESFNLALGTGGTVGFDSSGEVSGEMIVPADAFNSDDSSVNLNISNTDTNVRGNDEYSPLPGLTFDVQAEEQDNDEVDIASGKSLIFTTSFEVPDEYDADSVVAMEYDDNSGSLTELPSEDVTGLAVESDTPIRAKGVSKALKVTIKSLVGKRVAFVARATVSELPSKVSKVKVRTKKKANGKYKLTITWDAGDSATSYQVSILKEKGSRVLRSTTSTETRVVINNVKLKEATYRAKVTSVNTLGNGTAAKKKFDIED